MISITTFCYFLVTWSAVINEYVNALFYLYAFTLPPSWTSKHVVTWYLALWKATWIDIRFFSVSLNISFCLVCFPLVRHMIASWWSVAEIFGWLLGCPKMQRYFFLFFFFFISECCRLEIMRLCHSLCFDIFLISLFFSLFFSAS